MPKLYKIETAADVSNYTPAIGVATTFVAEENGVLVWKGKRSDGTVSTFFHNTPNVSSQTYSSITGNQITVLDNVPIGVLTPSGNYYPAEKTTISFSGSSCTINLSPYMAYDKLTTSNGTWTLYFATGTAPSSVLEWLAPDATRVTDIPAWNTTYQADGACWIAVSIVGCAGAVLLGTEVQYVDSHPMGFYVGGGTDSVYAFVFCPKGWFYKAFLSDTTATLSYSHKQIWKCKGA